MSTEERIRLALNPDDRLKVGRVIHEGYVPSNVADLVHCLNIALRQAQANGFSGDEQRIKTEISRLIDDLDAAIRGDAS